MTIKKMFDELNQSLLEIGKKLTLPNTSTVPQWNTLVSQITRLQLNIEDNETNRYRIRLSFIRELIPQVKAEITPCLRSNSDHLFAQLEAAMDRFSRWVDDNIPQVSAAARH